MEGKEERRRKVNKETREEVSRTGKREGEKGEDETVVAKRRYVNPVSRGAVGKFTHWEDSDSCGNSWGHFLGDSCGLSDCVPEVSSGVPVVADVPVSPSSSLVVMSDSLSDSDWEIVEPQSFSFSRERRAVRVANQENMSYEGTPVKAPQEARRRMMPPTPQQSSYPSIEAMQWQTEMEDRGSGWNARDRPVTARMEKYLKKSDSMKLEKRSWSFYGVQKIQQVI